MATCGSLACRLEEMWLMTTSTVSIRPSTTALSWQRQGGAAASTSLRTAGPMPRTPQIKSRACSADMGPREGTAGPEGHGGHVLGERQREPHACGSMAAWGWGGDVLWKS